MPASRGHIVNVVSVVAKLPVPNSGNYAATKAALDSLSLTLRAELSEYGILVTTVYPTATRNTNFFKTSGSYGRRDLGPALHEGAVRGRGRDCGRRQDVSGQRCILEPRRGSCP